MLGVRRILGGKRLIGGSCEVLGLLVELEERAVRFC